jgi:hypothetical protein
MTLTGLSNDNSVDQRSSNIVASELITRARPAANAEQLYWSRRGDVACALARAAQESPARTKDIVIVHSFLVAAQPAPACPYCDSEDTIVVRRNGAHGAISVCRCNKCLSEWPEAIPEDIDEKEP